MATKKSWAEEVDDSVMDAVASFSDAIEVVYPAETILQSMLQASFEALTPEQKLAIVNQMGVEWYVKMAAKMQRGSR